MVCGLRDLRSGGVLAWLNALSVPLQQLRVVAKGADMASRFVGL